ncbi:MAG: DDE-type integrase/transposase/recombinase [Planctomycetota bacterium]|nr:DDE-type integrase/transposase/recombinase [Planctomycetota bacterium]
MPRHERPHYAPEARFEIIQVMRLRHWSIATAAERFRIHANTIRGWIKDMNANGDACRLFTAPINSISQADRWLVHEIREHCPEPDFGTRSIAMKMTRAGRQLSRSSAQRILREKKPRPPPTPAKPQEAATETTIPHHILRPRTVNRTWHLDLTTVELIFVRFYVAAVLDGFSRRLLALRVYKDSPSTRNTVALVKRCVRAFGKPRFIITDHGAQFRGRFKRAMAAKPLRIAVVKGRKDRAKQFNGKVERFFKTFKLWQRLTLFARKKDWIQAKLDIFREWYNAERPMWRHGGRTPDEVWANKALPPSKPRRERNRFTPAIAVQRVHFKGDFHLPTLAIRIVDSVERIA